MCIEYRLERHRRTALECMLCALQFKPFTTNCAPTEIPQIEAKSPTFVLYIYKKSDKQGAPYMANIFHRNA